MSRLDERIVAATKPGTPSGRLFHGAVFFVAGLLFVLLGFWKTVLVIVLTALGLFVGSAPNLQQGIARLVNKWFPPRQRTVTYGAQDLEKVRKALQKDEEPGQT